MTSQDFEPWRRYCQDLMQRLTPLEFLTVCLVAGLPGLKVSDIARFGVWKTHTVMRILVGLKRRGTLVRERARYRLS